MKEPGENLVHAVKAFALGPVIVWMGLDIAARSSHAFSIGYVQALAGLFYIVMHCYSIFRL